MVKPKKRPKRRTLNGTPAVLPKRPEQKHTRFTSVGNFAGTLDSIALSISTSATKDNEYTLPDLEGDVYRTLRQYGLIMARYQIVDKRKFAKRYDFSLNVINTACRVVGNYLFSSIYDADPSDGTVHFAPLESAIKSPMLSDEVIMAVSCYMGTNAFTHLITQVKDPDALEAMVDAQGYIDHMFDSYENREGATCMSWSLRDIMTGINSSEGRDKRDALQAYKKVCQYLTYMTRSVNRSRAQRQSEQERIAEEAKQARDEERREREGLNRNPKVLTSTMNSGWEQVRLCKPLLSVSHTGLIGRRIKSAKEGKYVRDLGRIISDPEQRVFGRKTRALGGVVVVDCSGSMSLTDEEMNAIMKSSSGCTVIAYSSGGDNRTDPNMWLIARRGRQVRVLPNFPGGNGVDGPALEYGLSFRTHNAPVVWISDTQVTGKRGYSNDVLRDECLKFCRRHNIHIVHNCEQATKLLKKLQSGQRVINQTHKGEDNE